MGRGTLRVSGIAYRKRDKTIAFTGMAEPVDMSTIPFCYEDMEQFKKTRSFIMNPPEAVRFRAVIVFPRSIKNAVS